MAPSRRPPRERPLPQTTFCPHTAAGRRGGTNGYPEQTRMYILRLVCNAALNVVEQRYEQQLASAEATGAEFPARKTINEWARPMQMNGHTRAYVKQGNRRASVLRGEAILRLSVFKHMFPRSNAHETNAWLWNSSLEPPGQRRLYTAGQISEAEDHLGLSMKVSSTTARQALLPINILKRQNFWTLPYPLGIANIRREDLIDLDEAGVFVETVNRKYGKTFIGTCCREIGPYGHSTKFTLMMAVSADPVDRFRFYQLEQEQELEMLSLLILFKVLSILLDWEMLLDEDASSWTILLPTTVPSFDK